MARITYITKTARIMRIVRLPTVLAERQRFTLEVARIVCGTIWRRFVDEVRRLAERHAGHQVELNVTLVNWLR
jgi:hypothetical protein